LKGDLGTGEHRLLGLHKAQRKYDDWRAISLPSDPAVASPRYRAFLQELCRKHGMFLKSPITDSAYRGTTGTARSSTATHSSLTYNLQLEGTLPKLVGFLHDFYSLNLPHVVRDMKLERPANDTEGRLDIVLKVEALSLPNATNRDFLVALPGHPLLTIDVFTMLKGGPNGLALGPWLASPTGLHGARKLASLTQAQREYTRLVAKNVFLGLQAPATAEAISADRDLLKFVQLTGITSNFLATEATLYNRRTGKFYTIRAEGGFDSLEIRDANEQLLLKGTVKAIAQQDVVFLVGDKHYGLHIGGFLDEAMKKELTAAELKGFGVTVTDAAAIAPPEKENPGEP
jgi:hypothetical protein